jgi:hypothetical protein
MGEGACLVLGGMGGVADSCGVSGQFISSCVFGALIGWVFMDLGNDQAGGRKRIPALFFW